MIRFDERHESVLRRLPKSIVHMRKQVEMNRFGLIFGAGLSRGFRLPTWEKLVESLAKDHQVDGEEVLQVAPPRAGLPYKTEMLFEHYRCRKYKEASSEQHNTRELDYRLGANWRDLIRKHLYVAATDDIKKLIDDHPFLKQYLPIIRDTYMTVTYNFDDFLEQALLNESGNNGQSSRGFESVTNPWMQFRRTNSVIYHPNGVVPQNPLETPSDRFVFSEESYVKQLMGIFAGDQAGLVNHFSKNTCLLIGLSLEDDTLRNILMQAAHSCPGNFHYYVHYLEAGDDLSQETQQAILHANFKVYNLITFFLHEEEISTLGELIDTRRCPTNHFTDFAEQKNIQVSFRYYITGTLGVGKSTAINHFRNLVVLDEWLEQRPSLLAKRWDKLSSVEKKTADEWIINQFRLKNDRLRNEKEGIFILDRGPLDPITFTPDDEWCSKANALLNGICPEQAQWQVQDGRVILLEGESSELALRMIITKREDYTAAKLKELEERLCIAYGCDGVTRFNTQGLTPPDVASRMAEIIHLEPYAPTCKLHERLNSIKMEGVNVKK